MRSAWGWRGIDPVEIIDTNRFGNLLVKDRSGKFWRIIPEHPEARVVANTESALETLRASPEFVTDWEMRLVVQSAEAALGLPGQGRCYCLKISANLGGEFNAHNIGTIRLTELIAFSGSVGRQIAGLPDGTKVRLVLEKGPDKTTH